MVPGISGMVLWPPQRVSSLCPPDALPFAGFNHGLVPPWHGVNPLPDVWLVFPSFEEVL